MVIEEFMMFRNLKFLLLLLSVFSSSRGICSGRLLLEFEGHLSVLRIPSVIMAVRSHVSIEPRLENLTLGEERKKAEDEDLAEGKRALWGIQRGIEQLLDDSADSTTVSSVVNALERFGQEIDDSEFWKGASKVYSENFPDASKHWQEWFKSHIPDYYYNSTDSYVLDEKIEKEKGAEACFQFSKKDILGCLLYPVKYTFVHNSDDWECNKFVLYLQGRSALQGDLYARARIQSLRKGESDEYAQEKFSITAEDLSRLKPIPDDFYRDESGLTRLVWVVFGGNETKHGKTYIPRKEVRSALEMEKDVLMSIRERKTAESNYFLAVTLLNLGKKEEARTVLSLSATEGFGNAIRLLKIRFPE